MLEITSKRILVTGPSGFAGASQAMCSWMTALSNLGCCITFVGFEVPYAFRQQTPKNFKFLECTLPHTHASVADGAVGHPDTLKSIALAEKICHILTRDRSNYDWIWAHYLYPYSFSTLNALDNVPPNRTPKNVWITPHGSDIWQVGPQLPITTRRILTSDRVTQLLVVSDQFAREIQLSFNFSRDISVCPPIIREEFDVPTLEMKLSRRRILRIPDNAFVISCHCNMRPVKNIGTTINAVSTFSANVEAPVTLLLVGPTDQPGTETFGNLTVVRSGLSEKPNEYLEASDLEINTSLHDSFNISLAEAIRMGIPVITTDVVGILPLIESSGCGLAVPVLSNDPSGDQLSELVTNAIAEIFQNRRKWAELGIRGAIAVEKTLASSRIGTSLLRLAK